MLVRKFKKTKLPILLAILFLLELSQSLRSPAMRLLRYIQSETKFLRNMGNFVTLNSLKCLSG